MNDIYYYLGLIYILHYSKSLWDIVTFDFHAGVAEAVEKMDEIMPEGITKENINQAKADGIKKMKKGFAEAIPAFLGGVFSWCWLIYGVSASDSKLFIVLLLFSSVSVISTIVCSVYMVIKNKDEIFSLGSKNPKDGLLSITSKVPKTKIVQVIDRAGRIGLAIFILYQHFFIL